MQLIPVSYSTACDRLRAIHVPLCEYMHTIKVDRLGRISCKLEVVLSLPICRRAG